MKLKQKPNGIYYVDFLDDAGARRRVGLNTRDKDVARRSMRDAVLGPMPSASADKAQKRDGRLTMRDLFDRAEKTVWHPSEAKSQGTIRSNLKILTPMIGDIAVEDMTYTRLEELVSQLKAKGYAPGTIKRKMDMVSKALRMATKWTDARGRPLLGAKPTMPSIRVSNLKDRVLYRDEELAVFSAVTARRQAEPARQWFRFEALIRFLLDTGARLGEALNTGPAAVTLQRGHPFVTFERYRTKSDKPRSVPLTSAVVDALAGLKDHLGLRNGAFSYFPMTEGTAWYMWDNIRADVKALGFNIDDVTLHTLRHTCLTRLAQGGLDLLRLQKWAGHSDPKITAERYTHLQPDDLLGGLALLGSNPATETSQDLSGGSPASGIITEPGANRALSGTVTIN